MKPIKVLHIVYSLQLGGAEQVVTNYALHHDHRVYEPVVVALTEGGPLEEDLLGAGVKTYILGKRLGFDPGVILKLARIMRDEGIKIVHVHTPLANNWGVPAALLSGVRTIVRTEHGLFRRERHFYYFINAVLGLFNRRILACSNRAKESHVVMDPFSRKKYKTIYNGIDVARYSSFGDTRALRAELGLPEGTPVVGIIGSLIALKGHATFLRMAELVAGERTDVRFLIVGEGPLRQDLEAQARALGLSDRVIFAGVHRDIPEILSLMDVFVLSSTSEAHPLTILEAMAAGKPVVATDVGGNAESVVDGETGFIVPSEDGEKLFERVKRLLDDPALAQRMGRRGFERVSQEFTVERMVSQTEAVYEEFYPFRQKVLYVIGQLGIGGAEKQLFYLVRGLNRQRYKPAVVSLSRGGYWADAIRSEGVEVTELERKKNVESARLMKLLRVMIRFRPAIVHTYLSSANSYGRIAAALARIPIKITSERTFVLPESRFVRFMDSELSRFTDAIICNTRANLHYLGMNHRLHSDLLTIYNGIEALAPNGADRERLRAEFGVGRDELVVGTIGNLTPPKNHHFLLRVASNLLRRSDLKDRLRFIIIGGGILEKELRGLADSLDIASRVVFAGQRQEALGYLRAFDVFIMTSHYEGLSNAIMEGMLCELPCVVTDVGGNSELVTEGETGFVVPPGDQERFAARIAALLDDPLLRRAMGTRGAKRILNEFPLERMVGETEGKYEELLERKLSR